MTTGAAAEKYANIVKNTKYSVLAREAGVLFKPIVVESLGAWCAQARGLFSAIGSRISVLPVPVPVQSRNRTT
jgi:hypothetical protein